MKILKTAALKTIKREANRKQRKRRGKRPPLPAKFQRVIVSGSTRWIEEMERRRWLTRKIQETPPRLTFPEMVNFIDAHFPPSKSYSQALLYQSIRNAIVRTLPSKIDATELNNIIEGLMPIPKPMWEIELNPRTKQARLLREWTK